MTDTMKKVTRIYPGPGKIAITPLNPSEEIPFNNGRQRLWIPSSGAGAEGVIGRVTAVCEPYASDSGQSFEANYKVGDIVVIGKFTGTKLDIGNEKFVILYEKDVLASVDVVEEPLPEVSADAAAPVGS